MRPSQTDTDSESATAEMSENALDSDIPTKRRPATKLKKRNGRKSISISAFSEEEKVKAKMFDFDGDGELDEAELAMMRYDVDGDGNFTSQEVHAIVDDLLRDRHNISAMRKIIFGLTLFVFILSLSNLGTSIASALLVKETTADKGTAEMKIVGTSDVMGTQASAETFQALEMDVDTRRARRTLVVESLLADPFGDHTHRRLAKNKSKCTGKKCDSDITFDVNYMRRDDVDNIKTKCDQGRVVNVRRSFPGDIVDSKNLCRSGTTIIVKEKKTANKGKSKGNGKTKRNGFDMTVRSDGKETNFDCDGRNCYMSGSNLLSKHGEPCNLNHGSDDCESGLVCVQSKNDVTRGTCNAFWDDATWYVDWENDKCIQNCVGGPNCGGMAGRYDEQFGTYKLCCDTHLGWLSGGYRSCIPDLEYILEKSKD